MFMKIFILWHPSTKPPLMLKRSLPFFLVIAVISFFLLAFDEGNKSRYQSQVNDTIPFLAMMAKDHKGKSIHSTGGVVSMTTGLDNDFYQVDSTRKTAFLYAETMIASFMNDNLKRVPLNLCIVIDRSGSMAGVKLGYAKKAAKGIVEQLKTEDMVSIVMYDNAVDSVQVPVLVIDKESIYKKIEAISSRGGTNLWGGTEKGYEYVMKNYKPGYINRVLLISDGLANVGLTDPKLIRLKVQQYKDDQGITLSTFGVGLDYNESLMTDMAETGLGNYYFIDAPDKMTAIFDKELNGLLNVAAQNAEYTLELPAGVKLLKSYPLKYTESGNTVTIKLRDLFSQERKGTVFSFSIADGTNTVLKFISTLRYTDVSDGREKTLRHENILSPVRAVDAYLTHFNKPVVEQVILTKANENLELAMAAADKGDYKDSDAYVMANKKFLAQNGFYVINSLELRRMDSANTNYGRDINRVRLLGKDSVKRFQKSSKEANYFLRQKKQ